VGDAESCTAGDDGCPSGHEFGEGGQQEAPEQGLLK
jgi:hypothetical protein